MSEFKPLTTLSGNVLPGVPSEPGMPENAVRVTFAKTLSQMVPGVIEARDVDIADAIEETARRMDQSEHGVTAALLNMGAKLNPAAVPADVRADAMAGRDIAGASALRAQWGVAEPARPAVRTAPAVATKPVFGKRGTL